MADGKYKCHDCHMTFDSTQLLQKHKKKFCVGGNIGDPDNLLLRRGLWSAGTPSPPPHSPDVRKAEKKEYQKYNPNQDSQLRQLAENHGRQMEYLQIKNRDLEKQREDIRRRLEELANKGSKPQPTDNTAQLLSELRAQEERNKLALEDLRRQLFDIHGQRVNFIEVEKTTQPGPQPLPPPAPDRKSYVYPVYYGNSLVAEISAMRQAYLQNGGSEPDVLAQMAQMQAEAQSIEDGMKQVPDKKEKKDHLGQLQMLELENERLHKELMLLQEQNFMNRKKSDREGRHSLTDANPRVSFNPQLQAPSHHDPNDRLDRFEAKYGHLVQQLSKSFDKDPSRLRSRKSSVHSLPQSESKTSISDHRSFRTNQPNQNDGLPPLRLDQDQGSVQNNGQGQSESEPHRNVKTLEYQRELDMLELELAELQIKQLKSEGIKSEKVEEPAVPRLDLREITEEGEVKNTGSFADYLKSEKQKEEEYRAMPFMDSDDDDKEKSQNNGKTHGQRRNYSNLADNYFQPNWGIDGQSHYHRPIKDFREAGTSHTDLLPQNLYYSGPVPPAPKSDIVDMYRQLGRPIVFRNSYSDKGVALGQPYRV